MKKLLTVFAVLAVTLAGLMAYMVSQVASALELEDASSAVEYTTEYVMIQSVTDDGKYLNAVAINPESELEFGYILDKKYQLGDIVEITYSNDDLVSERLVEGEELETIDFEFGKEINALMEQGIAQDAQEMVMAEDGSFVPASFYE